MNKLNFLKPNKENLSTYLYSGSFLFLIAAYFAGSFKYNKGLINTFLKLTFSVSFIYIFGLLWLGFLIGWDKPIFELGAQPFLLAELFKILLLLFLTPTLLKAKKLMKIT